MMRSQCPETSAADRHAPHNPVRNGSLLVTATIAAAVPAILFVAAVPGVAVAVVAGLVVGRLLA